MVNYTYSKLPTINFNTTPASIARSATGSVYAVGDTTYTTPLNMTLVVGGTVVTSISSDANGLLPDFTLLDRTSCVWKQTGVSFATVLTTSDPVPGPKGDPGTQGNAGAQGVPGDVSTWKPTTFYPLNTPVTNPSGDLVKVTTAHTSTGSYDAAKFEATGAAATKLTGVVPDANLRPDLTVAELSATYAQQWKPNTAYALGQPVVNPSGDVVTAKVAFTSGATYIAANWNLSPTYVGRSELPYIDVDLQRLPADTDDAVVWQRAVNAAITIGVKRVVGRSAVYNFGTYVNLGGASGLSIEGGGMYATLVKPTVALNYAFTAFTDCSNIAFRNIGFLGTAVDDATGPRRARTFTGHTGFAVAIKMQGDLTAGQTPKITNVTLDQVYIAGSSTLPVLLSGIRGEAKIQQSRFHNNMDVGFIFCETAKFINNHVTNSADNGVSLSRGNQRVLCIGNTIDNCAYWGIWGAGYLGDAAPKDIAIVGNTLSNLGLGGVTGALGARNGVIVGNTFRNILRGPSDEPSDNSCGVGVFLSSFPSDPTAPTTYAENWTIGNNTFIDAARGGILMSGGVRNVNITANTFVRMGSQFLADGTTTVTTAMSGQNFGVAAEPTYSAQVKNVNIQGNFFIDDRATPLMNNGAIGTSAVNWTQYNNTAVGSRLQLSDSARTTGGVQTFTSETRFSAGFRAGFSGATGTIGGRFTGAAGSTRALMLQTEDVMRWQLKASSSAESGSNAGSDLQFEAFSDAGVSLGAAFTVLRSTQGFRHENKPLGFYGTAPIAKQTGTPAAATDLATALALVNDLRTKLLALGIVG